jgi:hypothetical protein
METPDFVEYINNRQVASCLEHILFRDRSLEPFIVSKFNQLASHGEVGISRPLFQLEIKEKTNKIQPFRISI